MYVQPRLFRVDVQRAGATVPLQPMDAALGTWKRRRGTSRSRYRFTNMPTFCDILCAQRAFASCSQSHCTGRNVPCAFSYVHMYVPSHPITSSACFRWGGHLQIGQRTGRDSGPQAARNPDGLPCRKRDSTQYVLRTYCEYVLGVWPFYCLSTQRHTPWDTRYIASSRYAAALRRFHLTWPHWAVILCEGKCITPWLMRLKEGKHSMTFMT